MFTDAQTTETIAQAAADAAYNAVHAILSAHTAPGVQIVETAPAAPALTLPQAAPMVMPQAAQGTGTGWEAADAYAAYRLHTGMDQATWKAVDTAAKAAIRAAQVAPFDRHTQRKDAQAAAAAFGQVAAAPVAQAAQAPQAAPMTMLAFGDMVLGDVPQAQAKAAKVQPAGTVALNALKRFAKAHGLQIPARGADVSPGTWAAVVAHVEGERAQGHTCNTDTVCVWLSAQTGR